MWLTHSHADFAYEGENNQSSDGMADEGCHNSNQSCKNTGHAIQGEISNALGDGNSNGREETGAVDRLAQCQATSSENDDSPEEVIEVLLGQDPGSEEQSDGDDGYYTHVAKDMLELVTDAPESDGNQSYNRDKVLYSSKLVLHGTNRNDGGIAARAEGHKEEDPDEEDADYADRQGDEKPGSPAWLRLHIL